MRKKNHKFMENAINNFNAEYQKPFYSPKHEVNIKQDYNTYMEQQKYKKMKIPNKKEPKVSQNHQDQWFATKYIKPQLQPVIISQLVRQNDYLIDEIMKYQQKVQGYQQKISKLKRCRSQKCTTLSSENNITIVDHQSLNYSKIVQSKLVKGDSLQASKMSKKPSTLIQNSIRCKDLLDQSQVYMNQSKKSLSYQIQQLNDRFSKLLERSSFEKDLDKRKKNRLEMSTCVRELKQLRRHYDELYQ